MWRRYSPRTTSCCFSTISSLISAPPPKFKVHHSEIYLVILSLIARFHAKLPGARLLLPLPSSHLLLAGQEWKVSTVVRRPEWNNRNDTDDPLPKPKNHSYQYHHICRFTDLQLREILLGAKVSYSATVCLCNH